MSEKSAAKLITPLARLSYPHVANPQPGQDGKPPQYGVVLIFEPVVLAIPEEAARFEALKKAAIAAGQAKFGEKLAAYLKSEGFKKGFRNDWELKGYPEGSVFISARSRNKPGVVFPWPGEDGKPARVPEDKIKDVFYPGAYVRASVNAFAFDNSGNKGLSFGLNNLQWIKDGDRLDNRVAAEDEFTADLSAAPASLEQALSAGDLI